VKSFDEINPKLAFYNIKNRIKLNNFIFIIIYSKMNKNKNV